MARTKSIGFRDRLVTLLPARLLYELARESEFVVRVRKIKPPEFLWTLVLGFAFGRERTIAGLRRAYETATRTRLVPSAFYDRFDQTLVKFLQAVVGHVLEDVSESTRSLEGQLTGLRDLLVTDSTVVHLHDLLAGAYRSNRPPAKAALKVHVVMSVLGRRARSVKITSERANDGKSLRVGPWVKGSLLLFDLAYYDYKIFERVMRNGGYFLSRAKRHINPRVVASHQPCRNENRVVGQKLRDVLDQFGGRDFDFEVEAAFRKRRQRRGRIIKHATARTKLRLVGLWCEERNSHDLYATNLPVERFSAEDVGRLYGARWSVELLFKSLKSDFCLDDLPSSNRNVVEALVYASILTWLTSQELLKLMRRSVGKDARRVTDGRWTRLVRTHAQLLLLVIIAPPRHGQQLNRTLEYVFLHECLDPHMSRPGLLEQAENRTGCQDAESPERQDVAA